MFSEKQSTSYTCGPTCLRMCAAELLHKRITPHNANTLTDTTPNGTYWSRLKLGFRKAGMQVCRIYDSTAEHWNYWLDKGYYLVVLDDINYREGHTLTVCRKGIKTYTAYDPSTGKRVRLYKDNMLKAAGMYAFAVCAKSRKNVQ